MDIGKIIERRRNELDLTLEEVGNAVGVSKSTVKKWESGFIENMRRDKIAALANVLRISPVTLITGDMDIPTNIQPMFATYKVPRIGRIACGEPITAEENIEDYDPVPDYIKADFTLVCKGDSMINARIFDGDIVCISQSSEVHSGDIAAVLVDGDEATLKRVRIFEDHIILEPENPMYKPFSFWNEDMNKVRIIGKATHFISAVR